MIKKLLSKIKESFRDYLVNHIGTNILLFIVTFIIILFDVTNLSDFMTKAISTLLISSVFSLLIECNIKDNKKRVVFYVIGVIISAIMTWFFLETEYVRYIAGMVLLLSCGIIYTMIKNSKIPVNEYFKNVITNLLKLEFFGFVINIGVMFILGIISVLLFKLDYNVFLKLELIIVILYYIPSLIISTETKEVEDSKFIKVLNNYILLPILIVSLVVVYLYIFKLIALSKPFATSIIAINAALILIGIPVILIATAYDSNKLLTKIINIIKYLFVPLILVQIIALLPEIKEHDITVGIYAIITIIVIEISSVILLTVKKGTKFQYIFLPLSLISIILFMIPYFNIIDYPNYRQIERLKLVMPEGTEYESLTKDQKKIIKDVYWQVNDEKYYPDYINMDELRNKIYNNSYDYGESDYDYNESKYIYYNDLSNKIDISNYNAMEIYKEYPNNFKFYINNKRYDLKDYFKSIYDYYNTNEEINNYMENNNIVVLDENTSFYVIKFTLNYDSEYLAIDGYILYK